MEKQSEYLKIDSNVIIEKYQNLNKQLEYQNMLLGVQLQQSIKKIEELLNQLGRKPLTLVVG